jgi:hypothetical protein
LLGVCAASPEVAALAGESMGYLPADSVAAAGDEGDLVSQSKIHGQPVTPWTADLAIMQWIPFDPLTVWVTRRSAARLQSM